MRDFRAASGARTAASTSRRGGTDRSETLPPHSPLSEQIMGPELGLGEARVWVRVQMQMHMRVQVQPLVQVRMRDMSCPVYNGNGWAGLWLRSGAVEWVHLI